MALNKATSNKKIADFFRRFFIIACGVAWAAFTCACEKKQVPEPVPEKRREEPSPLHKPPKAHRPTHPQKGAVLKADVDPLQKDLAERKHRRGSMDEDALSSAFATERVDELCAVFRDPATSNERRAEILLELHGIASPEVVALATEAASSGDPTIRALAIELLGTIPGENFSSVARLAFSTGSPAERAAAAALLTGLSPADVWQTALSDQDAGVRIAVLDELEKQPSPLRLSLAQKLVANTNPQLRAEAALVLGGVVDKKSVDLLIPLLDDPLAGDFARDGLRFLTGQDLETAATATDWWLKNRENYNAEMIWTGRDF